MHFGGFRILVDFFGSGYEDKVLHATDQLISVCIENGQHEIAKYQEDVHTMQSQVSHIMTLSERCLVESRIEAPSQLRPSAEAFVLHTSSARESGSMMLDSSWGPSFSGNVGQDLWRQLKRVSVPIFDGDKRKYEAWKASFVVCVEQAPMSAEYKLLHLRQYLSGDALKAIENLGHSAASYNTAKERLDRKFGGARRHMALQLKEVDRFKQFRPGMARDLEQFADILDLTVVNLKEADRVDELGYGSLYLKLVKRCQRA